MSDEGPAAPGGYTAGSRIAGYRLEEQIGLGGMAVVFRAHDERLDRQVALKILAPGLARDDAFRQRFIRESRAAAAVDDPHIIPVFEAGEADGVLFIAMRFVRGGDARTLLDTEGPLPPARAAEIIAQVASALDAAHARGLVHRDVKPANMLLDPGRGSGRPDHVYLSDFGLSKQSLAPSGLTSTGQFLGTLEYVAPEQIEGRQVDGRADQYALACAAFELLTGAPPFRRDQGLAVMYAQLSEPPPPLSSRRPDLPSAANQVLARALAKRPAERYGSCRQFAEALGMALGLRPQDLGPAAGSGRARPPTEIAGPAFRPKTACGEQPGAAGLPPSGLPPSGSPPSGLPPSGLPPAGQPEVPGRAAAGPPTEAASFPAASPTTPGPPGPSGSPSPSPPSRGGRRRPLVIGGCAAVAVVVGVAVYLVAGHHGGSGRPAIAIPGCTTATARAKTLTGVSMASVPLPGSPFGVSASRSGRFSFVSLGNSIAILSSGSGLAPTLVRTIGVPGAQKGTAVTKNGYLLATADSGAAVLSLPAAERGDANPVVGTLTSPHGSGAVEVAVSPHDDFAFVTLQSTDNMAVFNLHRALSRGFGPSDFIGYVPFSAQPVGIAASPDGRWLYVTSIQPGNSNNPGEGQLSVISLHGAETRPATSVLRRVTAGCNPARVTISPDGADVWVTDRQSNALLGFSAAALTGSDPARALIARVAVGPNPLGVSLVNGGTRIVVADSDLSNLPGTKPSLAVVSVADALAGRPALLGLLPSGQVPRQFAVSGGGQTLLMTVEDSRELRAFRLSDLP